MLKRDTRSTDNRLWKSRKWWFMCSMRWKNIPPSIYTIFWFGAWVQFCCGEMSSALPLVSLQREDIPYSKARLSKCMGYGERSASLRPPEEIQFSWFQEMLAHMRRPPGPKRPHQAQLSCGGAEKDSAKSQVSLPPVTATMWKVRWWGCYQMACDILGRPEGGEGAA